MKPVTMTPEIADQTIRYILNSCEGKMVSLSWIGGEPLMFPHIIDHICERVI